MLTQELLSLYRCLLLTRRAEEKMRAVYLEGQKDPAKKVLSGNLYLSTLQEAVSVGSAFAAKPTDWVSHTHRELGALLTNNRWELKTVFANILGQAQSPAKGRDSGLNFGSSNRETLSKHIFMGITLLPSCGIAWELKNQGNGNVVLAFFGDGATSQGMVHDAMNGAGLDKLPIIFICNNNQWAISTPVEKQVAGGSIAKRAQGYGFPGIALDGTDILTVYEAASEAIERARMGDGPTLLECQTFRLSGHAEHDDPMAYVPPEIWYEWKRSEHDPLWRLKKHLLSRKLVNEKDLEAQEESVKWEIEQAWEEARALPSLSQGDGAAGLFARSMR